MNKYTECLQSSVLHGSRAEFLVPAPISKRSSFVGGGNFPHCLCPGLPQVKFLGREYMRQNVQQRSLRDGQPKISLRLQLLHQSQLCSRSKNPKPDLDSVLGRKLLRTAITLVDGMDELASAVGQHGLLRPSKGACPNGPALGPNHKGARST